MFLFFVDMQVGDLLTEDAEGVEFPDASTARRRRTAGLIDMAKRLVTGNTTRSVTPTLRNDAGRCSPCNLVADVRFALPAPDVLTMKRPAPITQDQAETEGWSDF